MKGILFTEVLFNATIVRKKIMTRREGDLKRINGNPDDYYRSGIEITYAYPEPSYPSGFHFSKEGSGLMGLVRPTEHMKPRYKEGEILYLKEPYSFASYVSMKKNPTETRRELFPVYTYGIEEGKYLGHTPDGPRVISKEQILSPWKNKLFMGEQYARYYIKITDVRVERLFDISDEDCIKEGVEMRGTIDPGFDVPVRGYRDYLSKDWFTTGDGYFTPEQRSFFSLFRFANKIPKHKEIKNIWVFVYSYYLCDKKGNKI